MQPSAEEYPRWWQWPTVLSLDAPVDPDDLAALERIADSTFSAKVWSWRERKRV